MSLHNCDDVDDCKNGDARKEGSGTTIDATDSDIVHRHKTMKAIDYGTILRYLYKKFSFKLQ